VPIVIPVTGDDPASDLVSAIDAVSRAREHGMHAMSVAHREFDRDHAARSLGLELLDVADGTATVGLDVHDGHLNGQGTVHGGVLFLLADTAFGAACNGEEPLSVIASAAIEFLRPARPCLRLTATAHRRYRHGRTGVYDVTVRAGDEIVAEFRGRSSQRRSLPTD
jgi:acyl-CoA thioesterase